MERGDKHLFAHPIVLAPSTDWPTPDTTFDFNKEIQHWSMHLPQWIIYTQSIHILLNTNTYNFIYIYNHAFNPNFLKKISIPTHTKISIKFNIAMFSSLDMIIIITHLNWQFNFLSYFFSLLLGYITFNFSNSLFNFHQFYIFPNFVLPRTPTKVFLIFS